MRARANAQKFQQGSGRPAQCLHGGGHAAGGATLPYRVSSDRRNPYHVLGLKKGATELQIKEAYKVLARKHHPDRNPRDPGARERFIEIKEAYEALIERKTSSPVMAQVEETNAEFRRAGVYRRAFFGVGVVFFVVLVAGLVFFFRAELEFRVRFALADGADAQTAEGWLGPIARGTGPHAGEARLDLAKRHLAAGDEDAAARVFDGADDALGLAILGDIQARAGKRDHARKSYERAIGRATTAETSARAYAGLLASRDDAAAARVLADAEARYRSDPWVGWMVGIRELRASKPEGARRAVEGVETAAANAVRAAALVTEARLLGVDLRRMEDRKGLAREALAQLEAAAPTGAFGEFGWLRPSAEFLRKRPADWRPISSLDDAEAARDLARAAASTVLGREGQGEAIEYAKRARDRDSSSLEALLFLGTAYLSRGSKEGDDSGQAKVAFSIARSMSPRSARAAAGYALAIGSARPEAAGMIPEYEVELAAWKAAMELEPDNAEWAFGYARSLARGGRERSAERVAANRRAIKLAPDFGAPRLDLADALIDRDELSEAVRVLQAATSVPDVSARAWKELGDYYYFARQYPSALTAYRKAATDPDATAQAAAWLGAAKTLGRLRRDREAHEALDRATVLDRDLKPDHNDEAMERVFLTYEARPVAMGDDAAARALRLGDSYYKSKKYFEAFAAYNEASSIGDQATRARAWHGMARCYALAGNLGEAVLSMDRALKMAPDLALDARDPGVERLLDTGYEAPGKGKTR